MAVTHVILPKPSQNKFFMDIGTRKDDPEKDKATKAMPPGMVMGPDGKPCKVCTAFRNWKPRTTNYTEADSNRDSKQGSRTPSASLPDRKRGEESNGKTTSLDMKALSALASGPADATVSKRSEESQNERSSRADGPPPGCPPDVEQLGRATWTFLHTTAAYYPEKPTPTQRANMLMLLRSLPVLYACGWCADDFGKDIEANAPDVSGRFGLSRWLCERHNAVNAKLGKEIFDCNKVDERWKDGPPNGSCD